MDLRVICSTILLIAIGLSGITHAADAWFNDAWPLRRTLTLTDAGRGGKLRFVAYASVPSLGKCKSDGSDLRVVDDAGKEMRSRVVSAGFDDKILIAFEAPNKGVYKLYFGNTVAKETAKSF